MVQKNGLAHCIQDSGIVEPIKHVNDLTNSKARPNTGQGIESKSKYFTAEELNSKPLLSEKYKPKYYIIIK